MGIGPQKQKTAKQGRSQTQPAKAARAQTKYHEQSHKNKFEAYKHHNRLLNPKR